MYDNYEVDTEELEYTAEDEYRSEHKYDYEYKYDYSEDMRQEFLNKQEPGSYYGSYLSKTEDEHDYHTSWLQSRLMYKTQT